MPVRRKAPALGQEPAENLNLKGLPPWPLRNPEPCPAGAQACLGLFGGVSCQTRRFRRQEELGRENPCKGREAEAETGVEAAEGGEGGAVLDARGSALPDAGLLPGPTTESRNRKPVHESWREGVRPPKILTLAPCSPTWQCRRRSLGEGGVRP